MDAFEELVAKLLEREGFWVRSNFKVNLTPEDKRAIGRHSNPRWELDLVAYRGATNELWVVECKSFLDSPGVKAAALDGSNKKAAKRYKLFNEKKLREIVLARLVTELAEAKACPRNTKPILCLAAGHIASEADRSKIRQVFGERRWLLFEETWLRSRLKKAADSPYENDISTVAAKVLVKDIDETALTISRCFSSANLRAKRRRCEPSNRIVTIVRHPNDDEPVCFTYSCGSAVAKRGRDLIVEVNPENAEVKRVLRGRGSKTNATHKS